MWIVRLLAVYSADSVHNRIGMSLILSSGHRFRRRLGNLLRSDGSKEEGYNERMVSTYWVNRKDVKNGL